MTFFRRVFVTLSALIAIGLVPAARAAQSYIIVDPQSGFIFQQQEPKQKRQVGSLTKVATASVVLDWDEQRGGDLNQVATLTPEAFVGVPENHIGFAPGDQVQLRDLLYAALVQSDNIAANALAHHVGGQLQGVVPAVAGVKTTPVGIFVGQMNALAKNLRMEKTKFVNPTGSDNKVRPMPFSTAEDMARLTRYAINKASLRFYVSQKERQISFDRGGKKLNYMLRNTNELLGRNGVDGVKTGRTAHAGDCLILSANRESEVVKEGQMTRVFPRNLIVVLLASPNRFGEGAGMVQLGWQLYDQWAAAGRLIDPKKNLDPPKAP